MLGGLRRAATPGSLVIAIVGCALAAGRVDDADDVRRGARLADADDQRPREPGSTPYSDTIDGAPSATGSRSRIPNRYWA